MYEEVELMLWRECEFFNWIVYSRADRRACLFIIFLSESVDGLLLRREVD